MVTVEPEKPDNQEHMVPYELRGAVFLVKEREEQHLITCVKARAFKSIKNPNSTTEVDTSGKREWVVFNEFVLCRVSEEEAIQFSMDWKIPCVFYYCRADIDEHAPSSAPDSAPDSALGSAPTTEGRDSVFFYI